MDVVDKINGIQADPNTGQPAAPVVIKSITVVREVRQTPSSSSSTRLRSGPPP